MSRLSTKVGVLAAGTLFFCTMHLAGQMTLASASSTAPAAALADNARTTLHITLQDAIERAKKLSPILATALTNAKIAAETVVQARAANLPNVSANSQYLYTEGNGTLAARFIANNGVHEYIAQTDVHQAISAPLLVEYRRTVVLHAVAKDQATIAERGLIVSVVQAYATLFGAEGKLKTSQETLDAAQRFVTITQERETNGDAAHADVLKARIQADDTQSALNNAQLALDQARVALALLIFPNISQPFDLADDPSKVLHLPSRDEAQQQASTSNPELDAAQKNTDAARKGLLAARLNYLPSLTFDYYYGIDASQFAVNSTLYDGKRIQNLGYSALATLSMPLFTWGATHSKVKAAKSEQDLAGLNLKFAQRKAASDFELYYNEAQVAGNDLEIRQDAYTDAVESRHLTLLQYQAGAATALEVVASEVAVETESSALYDVKIRYATALANLSMLTGVL